MDLGAWYMGFREWLIHHPDAILISIFLVALIEAVAVIGVIVPAVPMLFVLCVLAAHADVPLLHLFIAGIAGAMMGDGISYSLGHGFKHRIHHVWPFSRYPNWLEHSEAFVERHGGKGIIFGRFIGPLRAFVPMAAGIFHMKPFYFLWMNFLSALVWAPFHLLPGYSLGAATAHNWLPGRDQLLFIGAILIITAILTWLLPALDTWRHRRAITHPVQNARLYFCFDHHPEDQRTSLALAGITFISVILLAISHSGLQQFDAALLQSLVALRQGSLDMLLVGLTLLSGKAGLLVFGSVFIGWLLLRGEWASAGVFTLAAIACVVLPALLQLMIAHPRPDLVVAPPNSWSFPSDHALNAVLMWGFILIFLDRTSPEKFVNIARPVLLALLLFGITAPSVLGIHWPSDALAGALLGLSALASLRWLWFRYEAPSVTAIEAVGVLVLALGLAIGLAVYPHFIDTLANFQIQATIDNL